MFFYAVTIYHAMVLENENPLTQGTRHQIGLQVHRAGDAHAQKIRKETEIADLKDRSISACAPPAATPDRGPGQASAKEPSLRKRARLRGRKTRHIAPLALPNNTAGIARETEDHVSQYFLPPDFLELLLRNDLGTEVESSAKSLSESPPKLPLGGELKRSRGINVPALDLQKLAMRELFEEDSEEDLPQKMGFFEAALAGDLGTIKQIIQRDRNKCHEMDANNETALISSAMHGRKEVTEYLLENGSDPNVKDFYGHPLILKLVLMHVPHVEILKLMIKYKADPNAMDPSGDTALIAAMRNNASPKILRILLKAGADPNLRKGSNITALMWAANNNRLNNVKQLLYYGANPDLLSPDDYTACGLAEQQGCDEIAAVIRSSTKQAMKS